MKLSLKAVQDTRTGLSVLSNMDIDDQKVCYTIARNIRKLTPEWISIEKQRVQLAIKHGASPTNDVPEDKLEAYQNEYEDLFKMEIDVDVQMITADMLDGLILKPMILVSLGDIYDPVPRPGTEPKKKPIVSKRPPQRRPGS